MSYRNSNVQEFAEIACRAEKAVGINISSNRHHTLNDSVVLTQSVHIQICFGGVQHFHHQGF
jgi:hypothetical protein